MNWNKEQELAIKTTGTNMIISAGAGSGKTAVLTSRVINHLKNGIHLNELLILTFTNEAAHEMKKRIEDLLKKDETLQEELDYLYESEITTFDAFALKLVKKYYYLLNIPEKIDITDDSLIFLLKKEVLNNVLEKYYQEKNPYFCLLIDNLCLKDDKNFENDLLRIINHLELKKDALYYLDNYIDNFYNDTFIDNILQVYENIILKKKEELKEKYEQVIEYSSKDYQDKLDMAFSNWWNSNTYDDLSALTSIKIPSLPKNSSDELKLAKESLNDTWKTLKELLQVKSKEELKNIYLETKETTKVIIQILKDFWIIYTKEKQEKNYFDFSLIANLSLKILEDYPDILEETKKRFKEILIDEYQDTNDLQEDFIKKIANNNVYMVGDIKQSIYRFRNANPYLFQQKYDDYSQNKGGMKIDLITNYRSKYAVINNINLIFNSLMDHDLGGASYESQHQMVCGIENRVEKNNEMEILNYSKIDEFTEEEIEIFLIAKDIQKRIDSKALIYDKKINDKRNLAYQDFCILLDRSTSFNDYQKIFNYLNIPLNIYQDETLSSNIHFLTIKNIFVLLKKMFLKEYDDDYIYSLVSISRNFLFNLTDEEIYNYKINNNWYQSTPYKTLTSILDNGWNLNLIEIYNLIIEKTNYYEKMLSLGDVLASQVVLDKIKEIINSYQKYGYDFIKFSSSIDDILNENLQIKYKKDNNGIDGVSLMTIHKSKGLEFPYVYYASLSKKFNKRELNEKILFSNKYGIISPIFQEGLQETFLKTILKYEENEEEISEKIRLFYVALTRAKEKMIFVTSNKKRLESQTNKLIIPYIDRLKCTSFKDFLDLMANNLRIYQKEVDITSLNLTKNYLYYQENTLDDLPNTPLDVIEINLLNKEESPKKISKTIKKLLTKEEKENINLGLEFHEALEYLDFKNPNYDLIKNKFISKKIEVFLNQELIKENLDGEIYHEYEYNYQGQTGIIDLLIIKDDKAIIIDYKLNNVLDEAYINQLKSYKEFILNTFHKEVDTYLYSLIESKFTNTLI